MRSLDASGLALEDLKAKLVVVTTDGESANTDRSNGLWTRAERAVEHPAMNFWLLVSDQIWRMR